jgi:hypothetical protein
MFVMNIGSYVVEGGVPKVKLLPPLVGHKLCFRATELSGSTLQRAPIWAIHIKLLMCFWENSLDKGAQCD